MTQDSDSCESRFYSVSVLNLNLYANRLGDDNHLVLNVLFWFESWTEWTVSKQHWSVWNTIIYLGSFARLLGLFDDALQGVDVGVDLPQLLHVRHLLLLQQLQLSSATNKQLLNVNTSTPTYICCCISMFICICNAIVTRHCFIDIQS